MLVDAHDTADDLRDAFYRMGFNDQEMVALAGAHTVGRCHPHFSGFNGPWTLTPLTFANTYFGAPPCLRIALCRLSRWGKSAHALASRGSHNDATDANPSTPLFTLTPTLTCLTPTINHTNMILTRVLATRFFCFGANAL
eukprot:1604626-Pleurochrysis_carterae.AAC.1